MKSKAQIAVEYVLIIGFVLAILMTALYLFRGYSISSSDRIVENKLELVANTLLDNAREVYYLGEGSKKIVSLEMPNQIDSIAAVFVNPNNNHEFYLVFNISFSTGNKEIFYESDVLIRKDSLGNIVPVGCYDGNVCEFYYFNSSEISSGIKNFKIEAKKNESNYVDIEMVNLE